MHLDNQKLAAIKKQKAELKKRMLECYDIGELIQMDMEFNILDESEKEILTNLGVET